VPADEQVTCTPATGDVVVQPALAPASVVPATSMVPVQATRHTATVDNRRNWRRAPPDVRHELEARNVRVVGVLLARRDPVGPSIPCRSLRSVDINVSSLWSCSESGVDRNLWSTGLHRTCRRRQSDRLFHPKP
jgi:hypothetical protein